MTSRVAERMQHIRPIGECYSTVSRSRSATWTCHWMQSGGRCWSGRCSFAAGCWRAVFFHRNLYIRLDADCGIAAWSGRRSANGTLHDALRLAVFLHFVQRHAARHSRIPSPMWIRSQGDTLLNGIQRLPFKSACSTPGFHMSICFSRWIFSLWLADYVGELTFVFHLFLHLLLHLFCRERFDVMNLRLPFKLRISTVCNTNFA